jgi:hypothetical protein
MARDREIYLKFHDFASIHLVNPPSEMVNRVERFYRGHIDVPGPCDCQIAFGNDVKITSEEVNYITRDAAFSSEHFFIRDRRDRVAIFDVSDTIELRQITIDTEFEPALFLDLMELVLHSIAIRKDRVFLHASAVCKNGGAIVFCAWRNTGKTQVLCELLRRGYQFLGDDWCVSAPSGHIYSYLKSPHLYVHDLAMSPHILQQRFGHMRARCLTAYLRLLSPSKLLRVEDSFVRWVELALLRRLVCAQGVHVTDLIVDPLEIAPAGVADGSPLVATFFLTRSAVGRIRTVKMDVNELVERMVACYRWEVRQVFDDAKLGFAFPDVPIDRMRAVMQSSLKRKQVYWTYVPPDLYSNQIADHIEAQLYG